MKINHSSIFSLYLNGQSDPIEDKHVNIAKCGLKFILIELEDSTLSNGCLGDSSLCAE